MIAAILCITPHGKRVRAIDRTLAEQMVEDGRAKALSKSLYEELNIEETADLKAAQEYKTRQLKAEPVGAKLRKLKVAADDTTDEN
jgi:hypothetical protein